MPRTRQVKHGLWLNEELLAAQDESGLGAVVTLTFIGLSACADREGRFRWKPRTLQAQIDPLRSYDFSAAMDALERVGLIVRYHVEGEVYGCLPNFKKHQSVHKNEAASRLPGYGAEITRNYVEPTVGGSSPDDPWSVNVASGVSGVSGEKTPPTPLPGGESGPAVAEGEGIPEAVLDAWDAHRGSLPASHRPPDPQTERAWRRQGRPSPHEVGRRAALASRTTRYARPDPPGTPLTFGRALRSAWADLGELAPLKPSCPPGEPTDLEREMAEQEKKAAPPEVAAQYLSAMRRKP